MTAEEWLPVPGHPGYSVSSSGRVMSQVLRCNSSQCKPIILRPGPTTAGYPTVVLASPGTRKRTRYVHHLVAEAFLGPRPLGLEIRHLDGQPANCHVSNLKYGTTSENAYDRVRHGTHGMGRKTHCKRDHPFDAANTYRTTAGYRRCRACKRLRETDPEVFAATAQPYRRRAS